MEDQMNYYRNKLSYEIDSWDLSVSLGGDEKILVVDARAASAFAHAHIPGAISLPHRTMSEKTTAELDKAALVVTYCDGIGCNASTKGALAMTRLGFRVKELLGGLDWWQRDGHEVEVGDMAVEGDGSACGCEG